MRRLSVLLSLAVAGGTTLLAAPAAHAGPICAIAWTEGTVKPNVSTGQTCIAYQNGVMCEIGHFYFDPEVHAYVVVCHPL